MKYFITYENICVARCMWKTVYRLCGLLSSNFDFRLRTANSKINNWFYRSQFTFEIILQLPQKVLRRPDVGLENIFETSQSGVKKIRAVCCCKGPVLCCMLLDSFMPTFAFILMFFGILQQLQRSTGKC